MIKLLDKSTADKIAAGEVVERPLSIVKELVENSIDAGASNVVVEIKNGGKSYIRVTDNGVGISQDECELAFMRHATSKIEHAEDLGSISTLGFRGEALASIAAVSRIELLTKTKKQETGRQLLIYGGEVIENTAYGTPDGTTIIVSDLFYNMPARLKFLKSERGESSSIIEFVTNIALAYPSIKIRMINNERILFATNGKGDRENTIATLTSNVFKSKLIPFTFYENGISVEGYISGPGESKSSRKNQIFFVNGRVVDSKVIEKGINNAYHDRLFEGRFPICYLFLDIPPESMDVNIHPNKRQVRFYDEKVITDVVEKGIITALNSEDAMPSAVQMPEKNAKILSKNSKKDLETHTAVDIKNILSTYKAEQAENKYSSNQEYNNSKCSQSNYVMEDIKEISFVQENLLDEDKPFKFSALQQIGQFFGTYIQLYDDGNIYFVDQHAAHERVFFEKFLKQFESSEKNRQPILLPITFDVSYADKENEANWLPFLKEIGFLIEEFGNLTYKVSEIPTFLELGEAEDILNDFVDHIGEYDDFKDKNTQNKIATRACKAAIKANDMISNDEISSLLEDLDKCENPFSCPHGRPTFIKISKDDMEKRFKRK